MTIYNFQLLNVPFANTAIASEIAPFPDYNRGLGIAFSQTDGKPEMKGLNGLFNIITASMLYLKQRGISEWDATLEYPDNAFVTEGVRLYKSKRINTNKQPSLSQNDWQVWASVSDIDVDTNGNIIKTAKVGGAFTLKVEDASATTKGVVRAATATEVANKSNVNAYVTPVNASAIAQSTDLGVGQTWQKPSRSLGATYTNNTGKPIQVFICANLDVGSFNVSGVVMDINDGSTYCFVNCIIPVGATYSLRSIYGGASIVSWAELR